MPTIRSLQGYTYPSDEVKEAIFIKKNNRLFFPTKELEKKYKHFTLSEDDDNVLVFKKRILVVFVILFFNIRSMPKHFTEFKQLLDVCNLKFSKLVYLSLG